MRSSSSLAYSQFIDPFERRPAFAANHCSAVAAHQRLDNLAALGAIERLALLASIIIHLFASPPPAILSPRHSPVCSLESLSF